MPVSVRLSYEGRTKQKVERTDKETANSDKNSRIHSSRDFWEDIEPKVNFNLNTLDVSATGNLVDVGSDEEIPQGIK